MKRVIPQKSNVSKHCRSNFFRFCLTREATSDRISLGITTVLTMTFLGLEARKDLPKVPYPTALDYFVFISFTYIFSTVVQVCMRSISVGRLGSSGSAGQWRYGGCRSGGEINCFTVAMQDNNDTVCPANHWARH